MYKVYFIKFLLWSFVPNIFIVLITYSLLRFPFISSWLKRSSTCNYPFRWTSWRFQEILKSFLLFLFWHFFFFCLSLKTAHFSTINSVYFYLDRYFWHFIWGFLLVFCSCHIFKDHPYSRSDSSFLVAL